MSETDPDIWTASEAYFAPNPINLYPRGYKILQLHLGPQLPKGWRQWINFAWGFDIWLGPVPFFKVATAANLIVWALLWRYLISGR